MVNVKGLKIGEGQPKICVPVVAGNIEEIKNQANRIMFTPADMVEWRVDHLRRSDDIPSVLVALEVLKENLQEKPILFTFRTEEEGGKKRISAEKYSALYKAVIKSKNADLIDIEYFLGNKIIKPLIKMAHEHGIKVILSNHDFKKTPSADEMIKRMSGMKKAGADIAKIAVMPRSSSDVLELLTATESMKKIEDPIPVITISMSALGLVSRITGEVFGSAVTFASAGRVSAPGQIDADELDRITNTIHYNLKDSDRVKLNESASRNAKDKNKRNIILIGFMGTGKTTVGKRLGEKTGMPVKEIDDMIEESAGMSITNIFEKRGEEAFRDIESAQVNKVSGMEGVIVSCGGGTVMRRRNVDRLKRKGCIILLRGTPELVYERIKRGGDKRPLLNRYQSRGYISWLMKKRRDTYMAVADYIIDVDGKNSDIIADEILDFVYNRKKRR